MRKYLLMLYIVMMVSYVYAGEMRQRKIKVLYTAALVKEGYEERKEQYIKNLKLLKKHGCDVYIVESCQSGPTFLDEFCKHVCYTGSNDPSATKSFNEACSMNIGFHYFNFDPDDMIIKITGRYPLKTDHFIRLVEANMDADVIARIWNHYDVYTGVFAIKANVLLCFLNHYFLNFDKSLAIEHGLSNFITLMGSQLKIVQWPKLDSYLPRCGPAEG